jgi:hypothetical protein
VIVPFSWLSFSTLPPRVRRVQRKAQRAARTRALAGRVCPVVPRFLPTAAQPIVQTHTQGRRDCMGSGGTYSRVSMVRRARLGGSGPVRLALGRNSCLQLRGARKHALYLGWLASALGPRGGG